MIRKKKMLINQVRRNELREEITGYHFGHLQYYAEPDDENPFGNYRYVDTDEATDKVEYPCPLCNKYPTTKGHDPCIANLPGVRFACCGHGVGNSCHGVGKPYLVLNSGKYLRGAKALAWFRKHNKGPTSSKTE